MIASPRTYSITKYGRPSGVAPASNTRNRRMVITASACRSASNRATTCAVSILGLDHFQRDLPANGRGLLGQPDLAHPAFPHLVEQTVRPNRHRRLRGWVLRSPNLTGGRATIGWSINHGR